MWITNVYLGLRRSLKNLFCCTISIRGQGHEISDPCFFYMILTHLGPRSQAPWCWLCGINDTVELHSLESMTPWSFTPWSQRHRGTKYVVYKVSNAFLLVEVFRKFWHCFFSFGPKIRKQKIVVLRFKVLKIFWEIF